jgi:hypothetical protein
VRAKDRLIDDLLVRIHVSLSGTMSAAASSCGPVHHHVVTACEAGQLLAPSSLKRAPNCWNTTIAQKAWRSACLQCESRPLWRRCLARLIAGATAQTARTHRASRAAHNSL